MSRCWAAEVSPCAGPLSGEHLISNSLLTEPFYSVRGPLWPSSAPPIAANQLRSKMLCKRHNEELSPLDREAGEFGTHAREVLRIYRARHKLPNQHKMTSFRRSIRGLLLERWVLKTGFGYASANRKIRETWHPPKEWAEIVFGIRPMPQGYGLAQIALQGTPVWNDQQFTVDFLFDATGNDEPEAVRVNVMGGWHFVVSWTRPVHAFHDILLNDLYIESARSVLHRPRRIVFGDEKLSRVSLDFAWPDEGALVDPI